MFNRLSDQEIAGYTHKALYCGFIPVYLDMNDPSDPAVITRNWVPEWLLSAGDAVVGIINFVRVGAGLNRISSPFLITGSCNSEMDK